MNYIWILVAAVVLLIGGFLFWKFRSFDAKYKVREEEFRNFRASVTHGSKAWLLNTNGEVVKRNGTKVVFRPDNHRNRLIPCDLNDLEPPC